MTTSGVTAWSLTARDLVTAALEDNAIIALGRTPRDAEMTACIRRLNGMLKSWQVKGAGLWRETAIAATILAGEATVELPEGVADVVGVRIVETSTYQRPLAVWERDDYMILPNKTSLGQPTAAYAERGLASTVLYLFPVPLVDTDLLVDALRGVETVTSPNETVDFPEIYQEAIYANLAVRCAGLFGMQAPAELIARAGMLEQAMLDSERPSSYRLVPYNDPAYYG